MAGQTKVTTLTNRRIRVEISRQVDFAKAKISFFCEGDLPDDSEMIPFVEDICEELEQLADDRIAVYEEGYDPDAELDGEEEQPLEEEIPEEEEFQEEEGEFEEEPQEEVLEEGEVEEEELDITEEEINKMTKGELVELCESTEGMEDIDTSANIGPLRAAIIDLLFEEGEEEVLEDDNGTEEDAEPELDESGGDWDNDDWQDE